jgi:hypothetical protein
MNKFTIELWEDVNILLDKGERDSGYYLLYKTLYEETFENKNYDNCNEFMKFIIQKDINSVLIVLILNILSPAKEKFSYWNEFVEKCTEKLIEQKGEAEAKQLLKVIV